MSSSSLWQDKAKTSCEKGFDIINVELGRGQRAAADFSDWEPFLIMSHVCLDIEHSFISVKVYGSQVTLRGEAHAALHRSSLKMVQD